MPKKDREWYNLDNSAIVHAATRNNHYSSGYRFSAKLKEIVDPIILQKAVDLTMPRFPVFDVCLKKGLFWYYFERNDKAGPYIKPDIINPCMPMRIKDDNGYLIRIYYYNRKISIELFHSLADGTGAIYFLKALLAVYLRLLGHEIPNENGVLPIDEEPDPEEKEDAYMRYATKKPNISMKQPKAYHFKGTLEPFHTLNIIAGEMELDSVLSLARKYNVTITEYLTAVLLKAHLDEQDSDHSFRKRPVSVAVPVSQRKFFPSKTLRNFIILIHPSIDPKFGKYTFKEILSLVHHYNRYQLNGKFMQAKINQNVGVAKNPLIRAVPLFIKNIFVFFSYRRIGNRQSSIIFTNLGPMVIPEQMKQHIERFDVMLGQPYSPNANCAAVSFENKLVVTFASCIKETKIEKRFFSHLVKDGIHVKIETNRS